MLAKSKKHRESEFGEWKKAWGVELGTEKEGRDEGKLRESIRCYGGTSGAGKTWALGAENRLCVSCVCVWTRARALVHIRGQIGKREEYYEREEITVRDMTF